MKQVNTDEFLSWLEEQAKEWEKRTENYSDWAVTHKASAQGYALAIRSCIWKLKSLQSEVDNS